MKKDLIRIFIIILIILFINISSVYAEDLKTETHNITILNDGQLLSIKESLTIIGQGYSNETYKTLDFWVSDFAENIIILVNNNEVQFTSKDDNEYTCNITSFNITKNSSIQLTISYNIDKEIEDFKRKIIRNTSNINVIFDENQIYTSRNLGKDTYFSLLLYKPTETPISWYIIVFIILLVILLAVSTIYSFRKQKPNKKQSINESEELLSTKKMLLMTLLKDIEKQHRSKKISDETHHKLKEQYKQQALETMKKLDDIQSKIK
jgi:hypothetical protein